MKQLTGVDASFLYMENGTSFGHVSGLSIFERPDTPGWSAYDAMRDRLELRLPLLEPLRRRVVEVPFQLDHPYWIEDPEFDLDYHLRDAAIGAPGDESKLAELVSRIIGRPLDRGHPLWECYVIEGLSGDRFAVLTKLHHATIDGASGAELMTILFDTEANPAPEPLPVDDRRPEAVPSPGAVMRRALLDVARKPRKLVRLQYRTVRALGELTRNQGLTGFAELARSVPNPMAKPRPSSREPDVLPNLPTGAAPSTPFNGSITAHRRLALRTSSLEDIKAIKNALGATINDVVMAVCAGGLREYLLAHDALPNQPLVAMVPISIRTGQEEDRWTNRVSSLFSPLPTDVDDPLARVQHVHQGMETAKSRFALMPADVLTDYAQFSPPALATRAIRLAARLKIADRMNPPFNLVVSNVPGPRHSLYLAGARLQHYYPVSTIAEGQGLNITVQSYLDTLDFALVACRELVPDVDMLADLVIAEIGVLAKAAGVAQVHKAAPVGSSGAVKPTKTSKRPAKASARKAS
ncbi:MAG: wax ester/triacylglycerol synthase family O-acyltransferase [Acidimicrobiales bacterium]